MGTMTYTATIRGKTLSIKAPKATASRIAGIVRDCCNGAQTWRELSGIVGGPEHASIMRALWTPAPAQPPDPEAYALALTDWLDSAPALLTTENAPAFLAQGRTILHAHIGTEDKRETPEAAAERKAEADAGAAERETIRRVWRLEHCDGDAIPIPPGYMAIKAELCYDNSDSMTDYFDRHCQQGEDLLLAIVPAGRQTEARAREAVARYPELAALTWTWQDQNYSMGKGYFLESGAAGTVHVTPYRYTEPVDVPAHWCVSFDKYSKSLHPIKGYTAAHARATAPTTTDNGAASPTGTARRNEAHNGIEVVFPAKPAAEVLDLLRARGFRWSFRQSLWYARFSPDLWTWASATFAA